MAEQVAEQMAEQTAEHVAEHAAEHAADRIVTQVEFHTGVADPVAFACRLLRRAARQGVRVQVAAPAKLLAQLDLGLWTHEEQDFVPHVRMPGAPAAVAGRTHIWLATAALQDGAPRVLMNLGTSGPADVLALERVIEIVGVDPDAVTGGRQRWRAYAALGLSPEHMPDSRASAGPPRG